MNPNSCTDLSTISLNEQTNFRLNEINKIKNYFESEIKEREEVINKLSKYITGFDYTDKSLVLLATTFSGIIIFFSSKNLKIYTLNKFSSYFIFFFKYSSNKKITI